ncbi:MAG: ATP-binding protein [Deltaproteobacteria bacterium]|nr:ATP-binding protein [Deltaproteobacteria bacterium]
MQKTCQRQASYLLRLLAILDKVLSEDIPDLFGLERTKIPSLRRLLWIIYSSPPFKPNIEGLSRDLGLAKESVYFYLECLEKAGLLKSYKANKSGAKHARKPAKLYPANTNLLAAIVSQASLDFDPGMVREVFFQAAISEVLKVHTHLTADFLVESKLVFEVGGPGKDLRQVEHAKTEGFLALDGIEVGSGKRIPLYLFGFLY